jgi:hypothetical protein
VHKIVEVDLPRPRESALRLTDRFLHLVGELNRELYRMMA